MNETNPPEDDDFLLEDEDFNEDDAFFDETFDDAELDYLDDDFAEEDWDEEGFSEALVQKEKKNLDFNKIAIVGALLAGFCVLGYQVYANRPEVIQQFKSALNMTGATDGPVFGKSDDDEEKEQTKTLEIGKGFLNDPAVLDPDAARQNQSDTDEAPPMPAPIAQNTQEEDGSVLTPMPTDISGKADSLVDTQNREVSPMPRSPDEMVEQTQTVQDTQNEADPFDTSLTDTSVEPESPNAAQALLEQAVAQRTGDTAALQAPEQSPSNDAALLVDTVELENNAERDKAEKTEEQKEQVAIQETTKAEENAPEQASEQTETQKQPEEKEGNNAVPEEIPPQTEALEDEIETLKAELEKLKEEKSTTAVKTEAKPVTKTTPKETPVQRTTASDSSKTTERKTSTRRVNWVLRSAQPGKAWVSNGGENDVTAIIVGDTLKGIGTVTDISYQNGRWIVQGTTGRINQ